jgi:sucrose-6-phosphate hydrolase SacC (GH32 family)
MPRYLSAYLLGFVLCTSSVRSAEDLVFADFEGDTYAPWKVTGDAFGPAPARGALTGQMQVEGFMGNGLVNTFYKGDNTKGSLTSPEFRIERKFISFLIGGGKNPDALALRLLVAGKVVRSATGPNEKPGGSEALASQAWDVSEFRNQSARLEIIDRATGGWGHINVDHIVQTDEKPKDAPVWITNAQRDLKITARYLQIPIKNGAPKRVVTLLLDDEVIVRNEIELADADPDWWAPMDVSAWKGKTLSLRVDQLSAESAALRSLSQSDEIKNSDDLYREPLRGQFHFSPRRGWNNDPNGMVYFGGEYHLFFQHNPYGWAWGNMHWGHAVSKDLVHWEELGDPLWPDALGPMFSGGAVVDWNNTSGFGKDGKPPLVLFYTAAGNPAVQCLAYSLDGRTFTKYAGNPVVKQITPGNRDPKVIWHEPTKKWVMVLYVTLAQGKHSMHFFTSANLRDWSLASITEGIAGTNFLYECPEFFELPVDGDASKKKWVLLGANSEYAIGSFDGTHFTAEHKPLTGHRGRGFYAPQTFSDVPEKDGRRILIGWFQTETKGMPFNQSMSMPLELGLVSTADGPRLTFSPLRELAALRKKSHVLPSQTLKPEDPNPLAAMNAELCEIRAEIEPEQASEIEILVRGATIRYQPKDQQLTVNGHQAFAPLRDGKLRITIYCDRTGLEVFASDGLCFVPMPFQPKPEDRGISLKSVGGPAKVHSLEVHELRSAWKMK